MQGDANQAAPHRPIACSIATQLLVAFAFAGCFCCRFFLFLLFDPPRGVAGSSGPTPCALPSSVPRVRARARALACELVGPFDPGRVSQSRCLHAAAVASTVPWYTLSPSQSHPNPTQTDDTGNVARFSNIHRAAATAVPAFVESVADAAAPAPQLHWSCQRLQLIKYAATLSIAALHNATRNPTLRWYSSARGC